MKILTVVVFILANYASGTPYCGVHRPYRSSANLSSRIDRRGISETLGNPGITENLPFNANCFTMGFFFFIQNDSLPANTKYQVMSFNMHQPFRLFLVKNLDGLTYTLYMMSYHIDGMNIEIVVVINNLETGSWYHFGLVKIVSNFKINVRSMKTN